ncbi:trimeric intracellular cation channel family protein [Motilimonas cestriensis]|uniref:Trimeric intracellular cation channel family protein n=1 Tax=Motilimonas cestriensis TaxID=2742685 RepID=A0ABS8WGI8_9GAMM|nr:trimeric intracellular cation channel family protein [Motilimonas cestriensis]MCE2596480.1 trimeric intracellular cation channel family protein [Motilimonas cestriensis]
MLAQFVYFSDLLGCIVFAISGVLVAGRLKMDPIGVVVLASVTAIGGGTIRDMAIGATPVFWINDTTYLYVIFATALISMLTARKAHRLPSFLLPVLDAFGLALFTVIGAEKVLSYELPSVVAIVMGVITGVAGGMIRDVLAGQIPFVLQKEIYATASILGGVLYTVSLSLGLDDGWALGIAMAGTLGLRLAALRWHLSLPVFNLRR